MQLTHTVLATLVVMATAGAPDARADTPCDELATGIPCSREPDVMVAIGVNVRYFAAPDRPVAARVIGPVAEQESEALTATERLAFALARPLYVAVEVELGNFGYTGTTRSERDVLLGGVGAVGLRGNLGFLSLSAELVAGGLAYAYPNDRDLRGAPLVELRGRADLWVNPWFTIGATLGTSLIRDDEWLAGVTLASHTAAFAGL